MSERARLEQILAALPVLPERRESIKSEAARLSLVAQLHRVNDLPRTKRAGSRAAMQEIDKLTKLSLALIEHIYKMHREALDAVDSQRRGAPHPLRLADDLIEMIDAAQRARGVVPTTPAARDLHSKKQARRVTAEAALVFKQLTGKAAKPATRHIPLNAHPWERSIEAGLFAKFLDGVFKVLEVDASAASQIKLLSRKKPRSK